MLYTVGSKTYIQHMDIEFIKTKLPRYPETLSSEPFFNIDEEELKRTEYVFEQVTEPKNASWLERQGSWLFAECANAKVKIGDLRAVIDMEEGFALLPERDLPDEKLDRVKTEFRIKSMKLLLADREGKIHFPYPELDEPMVPEEETRKSSSWLMSFLSALFRHA